MTTETLPETVTNNPTVPFRPTHERLEQRRAALRRNLEQVERALAASEHEPARAREPIKDSPSAPAFDYPLPVGAG